MVVVDASVILRLLLDANASPVLEERLLSSGESLHAPAIMDMEVTAAIQRYGRTGEMEEFRMVEAMHDLADLPIRRYTQDWMLYRMWEMNQDVSISIYDAAYLALAEGLAAPLVTGDRIQANTTGHTAQIEFFS